MQQWILSVAFKEIFLYINMYFFLFSKTALRGLEQQKCKQKDKSNMLLTQL